MVGAARELPRAFNRARLNPEARLATAGGDEISLSRAGGVDKIRSIMTDELGAQILLVEDNADTAAALLLLMEFAGYRVATADNGESALHYLRSHPPPSLIILDLFMPRMNGWQFRREIAKDPALANIAILVTTALGTDVDIKADAILVKPVDIERLFALIAQIVGEVQSTHL